MRRYVLALFDEAAAWKPGDADRRKLGDPQAGGGRRKAVAQSTSQRFRDPKTGEFVSAAEFEAQLQRLRDKEHELNQENAKRRTENNELKGDLKKLLDAHESIKARAIRTEAVAHLSTLKAIDADVADIFLKWAGDKVKVGENLSVEGVTAAAEEFKKAKPKLFEADGTSGGTTELTIDKDSKPNATAPGGSPLSVSDDGRAHGVKLDFTKGSVEETVSKYANMLK